MSFGKIEKRTGGRQNIGPQERIAYHGELRPLLEGVSNAYGFGAYKSHEVKQNGYEDFNVVYHTESGPFFVKFFASWRTDEECQRYVGMIQAASDSGVVTPGGKNTWSHTAGHRYIQ